MKTNVVSWKVSSMISLPPRSQSRCFLTIDAIRWTVMFLVLLSPSALFAAASMQDYCAIPPYVKIAAKPNLLLMIDNSASQYDLQYQDTSHTYCANAQTTACTQNSDCPAAATCTQSVATATSGASWSAKACTADGQCPNSSTTYVGKTCAPSNHGSDCPVTHSCTSSTKTCSCNTVTGVGDCVVASHPCQGGFCNTCNTSTGAGDCVSTGGTISYSPIPCTSDANCTGSGTTCPAGVPAGSSCTWVSGDTCNNKCNSKRQCYDATYSDSTTYSGYFTSTGTYSYDLINSKFASGATIPGTCSGVNYYGAGTPLYLCVQTSGSGSSEALTSFIAKGNFLNWLTASKFDIQKQILTGGKFDTTNNVLIAEARGCSGRKFVKALSGVSLTFAIRGGTPGGVSSTQSLATEYGQTYVEIYKGTYNTTDCLNAMYDWTNYDTVNLGSFQNDTKGCVGAGNSQYNAVNIWNHILHDCYDGLNNKAQGYSTNLNALEVECENAYGSGVAANTITDPNSGIAICSSVLSYTDSGGTAQTGYIGKCWNGTVWDNTCAVTQMTNFCIMNVTTSPVVDPSSTVLPGTGSSVPGFIMEQGLMNEVLVGTLTVRVGLSSSPTGLLDSFKGQIRFGAMTFNYNGSAYEDASGCAGNYTISCPKACSTTQSRMCYLNSDCPSGESCVTLTDKDGGKIISYIGVGKCSITTTQNCIADSGCPLGEKCVPYVGDHSTGLINQIDSIVASTWTPFSEAMFDAVAYYTQSIPPASGSPTTPVRLNSTDFTRHADNAVIPNPVQYMCQDNNILLITDGMSTADRKDTVVSFVAAHNSGGTITTNTTVPTVSTAPIYYGSVNVDQVSWFGQTQALTNPDITGNINKINTHVVYSGKACPYKDDYSNCCATSSTTLDSHSKHVCSSYASEVTEPERLMQLTAQNGGGSYSLAQNPQDLKDAIYNVFNNVIGRASAGTAASVLASGEGSGANLIQAIYYPKRVYQNASGQNDEVGWTGRLANFWYYANPFFTGSTIMDDYSGGTPDGILNISGTSDRAVTTFFVPSTCIAGTTFTKPSGSVVNCPVSYTRKDGSTGNCNECTLAELRGSTTVTMPLEELYTLWEAGSTLWSTSSSITGTTGRAIYTPSLAGMTGATSAGTGTNLITFDDNAKVALQSYLQAADQTESMKIIDYTRGMDVDINSTLGHRERKWYDGTNTRVWPLGDIVDSTPRIASWMPVNTYDLVYGDQSYANYTKSSGYTSRGMVFVGANDGMLHAFKMGKLQLLSSTNEKAKLINPDTGNVCSSSDTTPCGKEMWAFVPSHALPYLRYMADPAYCHVYGVDLTSEIIDVSIGGSTDLPTDTRPACTGSGCTWRTILIGGMRFGGACKNSTSSCTVDLNGDGVVDNKDCVKTPINGVGYSSYFALDITDTLADPTKPPVFLWEFTDPTLGFSSSGPAVVRVGSSTTNGYWYVVFGSGPTGPIDTDSMQFMGGSDQSLKFFAFDLKGGPGAANANVQEIQADSGSSLTSVDYAFSGPIVGSTVDPDLNYQDNVIYAPYTKKASSGTWTDGGLIRIITKESSTLSDWKWSTVIDGIGPVTTSVAKLLKKNGCQSTTTTQGCLWLFGGTGRYYYKRIGDMDDPSGQRILFGIKEPCYDDIKNGRLCTTLASIDNDVTSLDTTSMTSSQVAALETAANTCVAGTCYHGWKIRLDLCADSSGAVISSGSGGCSASNVYYRSERVVTNTVASGQGVVFFTTLKPYENPCSLGGKSFMWAVRYNTGGAPSAALLKGQALLQLSTGSIMQLSLSQSLFSASGSGGRKTSADLNMEGIGGGAPQILGAPLATKRVIHLRER